MDKIHQFYCSKIWRDLSFRLKVERGGKCEKCGFTSATKEEWAQLIGHHKEELTEENVNDPNIALNPDMIEIECLSCHNKEHRRFGHSKKIYIVYGSPLSGKTTLVRELMQYGDLVMDLDSIWQAVSLQDMYIKPDNLRFNVFRVRDNILDQIKTRYGQFYDAYIIGGYPDKYERERLSKELGAELIYCESTKEECLKRLVDSNKPRQWEQYINTWWEEYERSNL